MDSLNQQKLEPKIFNYPGDYVICKYVIQEDNHSENLPYIGIDPGTANFGIAIVRNVVTEIFQVKIVRKRDPIERAITAQRIIDSATAYTREIYKAAVIEGAAYSSKFRQVELAEQRIAVALMLNKYAHKVEIVNPLIIRKKVFGSAKVYPNEVFRGLPRDAAAALACAKYAMMIDKG